MKALIPQELTRSPNYFGLLNNLMTLIICESLREIDDMACVTPAWSSREQTLKSSNKVYLEKMKNKRVYLHIRRIPKVIPFKLFLDIVPSSLANNAARAFIRSLLVSSWSKERPQWCVGVA